MTPYGGDDPIERGKGAMNDGPYDLIAGCGDVGGALGLLLLRDGRKVLALRRRVSLLPEGLLPVEADLFRPASIGAALPEGVDFDTVYYTAAAEARTEEAYRAAYVDGLRNLLGALAARRLNRLIYVSSTAVYGQRNGEWVDEESPAEAERFQGRVIREGEERALRSGVPRVVVRFGGIYGPGREWLINLVRQKKARIPRGEPVYTNRIHRDDAAGVLRHVARLGDPAGLYVAVDREPAGLADVFRWLAARLGMPEPPPGDDAPERGSKRCRSARLVESGYEFRYPTFREGYGAILDGREER